MFEDLGECNKKTVSLHALQYLYYTIFLILKQIFKNVMLYLT